MEPNNVAEQYSHVLNFYKKLPVGVDYITVEEYETIAFERLQLLQILEQAGYEAGNKILSNDWKHAVIELLRKQRLRKYIRLIESTGEEAVTDALQRDDFLSHFILRLTYCKTVDSRAWFLARELELFKMRFRNLSAEGVRRFLDANELNYAPISAEEKDRIVIDLVRYTIGYTQEEIERSDFYKVPFVEVTDLVRTTSCYLSKGWAYIPADKLVSCISSKFRAHLRASLTYNSKRMRTFDDERILDLIAALEASYSASNCSNTPSTSAASSSSSLTAANIHQLSPKSFPLCMRNLYDTLLTRHHLKYFGRLQFGLFLKGIGLSLDEAIRFWRTEFCKGDLDADMFNKKYLYYVKYSYGNKGKMANYAYTPYECKKIIGDDPGPEHAHGCPFKLWDGEFLERKIRENGASANEAREISQLAAKGNYQSACSKHFTYTHRSLEHSKQIMINHPNQYFDESQKLLKQTNTEKHSSPFDTDDDDDDDDFFFSGIFDGPLGTQSSDKMDDDEAELSPFQVRVYRCMKENNTERGLSRSTILKNFSPDQRSEVDSAIDYLCSEGHIFTTVDADHFMITNSLI